MEKNNMTTMQAKDMRKVTAGSKVMGTLVQGGTYLFLFIMALIVLFPFYWMIISSLKSEAEYRMLIPTFWPQQIMWGNYVEAFNTANLGNLFLNTVFVAIALN